MIVAATTLAIIPAFNPTLQGLLVDASYVSAKFNQLRRHTFELLCQRFVCALEPAYNKRYFRFRQRTAGFPFTFLEVFFHYRTPTFWGGKNCSAG